MKVLIAVEQTRDGYSAFSPDVEGGVAAAPPGRRSSAMREAFRLPRPWLSPY